MEGTSRFLFGVLAATVIGGCGGDVAEFQAPPPPPVTVASPTYESVTPTESFPGRVEALEVVEIRARVAGFLKEQRYRDGDRVEAGDMLFLIEQESFESAVQSAEAALEDAKSKRDLAEVTFKRVKRAEEQEAANPLEVETAAAELRQAEAGVARAEAALADARLDLSYTEVRAPAAGRVSRREVDLGNLVGAGEPTLLATIVQDESVYVNFDVPERAVLDALRTRQEIRSEDKRGEIRVDIRLADGERYPEQAVFDYLSPRLDPETGTLRIRALAPNDEGRLVAGMFVRVDTFGKPFETWLVPEIAVQRDLIGPYLLTVDGENTVARADVELGDQFGDRRAILSGLEGDERVIVRGMQRAAIGGAVTIAGSREVEEPREPSESGGASGPGPDNG